MQGGARGTEGLREAEAEFSKLCAESGRTEMLEVFLVVEFEAERVFHKRDLHVQRS